MLGTKGSLCEQTSLLTLKCPVIQFVMYVHSVPSQQNLTTFGYPTAVYAVCSQLHGQ